MSREELWYLAWALGGLVLLPQKAAQAHSCPLPASLRQPSGAAQTSRGTVWQALDARQPDGVGGGLGLAAQRLPGTSEPRCCRRGSLWRLLPSSRHSAVTGDKFGGDK